MGDDHIDDRFHKNEGRFAVGLDKGICTLPQGESKTSIVVLWGDERAFHGRNAENHKELLITTLLHEGIEKATGEEQSVGSLLDRFQVVIVLRSKPLKIHYGNSLH